jgi:two-component system, NtrC family, response regulator AtoC
MRGRVLIVDDDAGMCAMLDEGLARRGYSVACAQSADGALEALARGEFDCVVSDLHMRGLSGLALCERISANREDVPVIVITAFGSMETAIAAIRAGAYDFITKPFELEALVVSIDRALQYRVLRAEVKRLRERVAESERFHALVGESAPMRQLFDLVARVAATDSAVLVTGETGTGKELVARTLHERGARRAGPFVALNCSAMPETLLESELFGHTKGAFTDARESRKGLFLQADGGTLFLDEIGDMPLGLQPKLLRALEQKRVRPVGGDGEVAFDARIIAATHRDLETAVEERRFREDLFFRVNVIGVHVPPLRSRGNDVLLLAQNFIQELAARAGKAVTGLSDGAAAKLLDYAWPGNVRELRNCVERAVAMTSYERITPDDLPEKIRDYRQARVVVVGEDPGELVTLAELERRYIARALEAAGGNKTLAAKILGLDRTTLYRKLSGAASPENGGA